MNFFLHVLSFVSVKVFTQLQSHFERSVCSCCLVTVEPNTGHERHRSDSEETPEDLTPLRNRVSVACMLVFYIVHFE